MARYRKINPQIWNDKKFRDVSDNAKLIFFLLLTHPHTSAIGTLRAYVEGLAPELGWSLQDFRKGFRELLQKEMVKYDERAGLVWLPNFIKHNAPENPNVVKSWLGALNDCPESELKNQILSGVKEYLKGLPEGFAKPFAELSPEGMPNQEQEQEQEQEIRGGTEVPACPPCPHGKIVALYHACLPELRQVKQWGGERESHLRTRWRERWAAGKYATLEEGLAYWERLFRHIHDNCDFLMGRKNGYNGREPFMADIGWLVCPENFAKVIEGKYDNRMEAA